MWTRTRRWNGSGGIPDLWISHIPGTISSRAAGMARPVAINEAPMVPERASLNTMVWIHHPSPNPGRTRNPLFNHATTRLAPAEASRSRPTRKAIP